MNKFPVIYSLFIISTILCITSCYAFLKGEYTDIEKGLGLEVKEFKKEKLLIVLYTTFAFADGFTDIEELNESQELRNATSILVTRDKSLLGNTYYSAIVEIPLSDNSKRIQLLTLRGHEGYQGKRRYFPAEWWHNEIIIDIDMLTMKIKTVEFNIK